MASEWSAALPVREDIVDGKHCIAPACLNSSLHYSRQNLGLETIDLLYLHNVGEKQLDSNSFEEVMNRLEEAFKFLEKQRKLHYIRYYGLATWTSFRSQMGAHAYLPLRDIVDLAVKVGGEQHGFRYVQLPLTVTLPEAATAEYDRSDTITQTFLETAAELKITVMTSRSISMAKPADLDKVEQLYKQCMEEESEWGPTALRQATGGQPMSTASLSLLMTRSVPGVTTALVGMKSPDHVKQNLAVMSVRPMPKDVIIDCIFKSAPGAQKVEQLDIQNAEPDRWHLRHSDRKGRGKGKPKPRPEDGEPQESEEGDGHDHAGAKRRRRGGKKRPKGKSMNDVFNT
jgi:aryl-alcohol dehydrogenase-like predicted oxidoreductase